MENKKELTFRNITYPDLENIVTISKLDNDKKFENWFSYKYKISEDESAFLNKLIRKNKLYFSGYNEYHLRAKFISPILNKVDFVFDDIKDWYEYSLSATINGFLLKGRSDFMIAKGNFIPKKPYFFLQEFKPTHSTSNPEFQLLAEMLVAMTINKNNVLHGGYIIGRNWLFLRLEKLKNETYEYFVSKQFDCLDIDHLRQIYTNLQAVKELFCKD